MMLSIQSVLCEMVPDAEPRDDVIRIETSHAVYLLFDRQQTWPRWVLRLGSEAIVTRTHTVMSSLYTHAPDLVPSSLTCGRLRGDVWVHVQSGVPGWPWFRTAHVLRGPTEWLELTKLAAAALSRFQAAVKAEPGWRVSIDLARELESVSAGLKVLGHCSQTVHDALDTARARFRGTRIHSHLQHGDFCVNNLVIDGSRGRVIDFDEFGTTGVPLNDVFSLAFSLEDFFPARMGVTFTDHLAAVLSTVEELPGISPSLRSCLLLHYLAWRVVNDSLVATRLARVRLWEQRLDTAASTFLRNSDAPAQSTWGYSNAYD